jgi:hypothetical protein
MKKPVISRLPMRVSAQILLSRRVNNEPLIVLMIHGVGTTSAYEFRDDEGRDYVCRWENKAGAHVIRVPASLWAANNHRMARACMERRRQQFPLVVSVELAEQSAGTESVEVSGGQAETLSVIPVDVPAPDFDIDPSNDPLFEPLPEPLTGPIIIGGVALSHIISGALADGPMRIKSLIGVIGGEVTEDQIKHVVLDPDSGFALKSGGWVAVAE